jgi:ATP phosphoribosyltransferase
MNVLRIGIPKGSLQDSTVRLFGHAGYHIGIPSRSYNVTFDDDELAGMLLRPQEMALYVEQGVLDVGLAGKDWVTECGADVQFVTELVYSRASNRRSKWVIAAPAGSGIDTVADLEGKVVYSELVNTTREWLEKQGVNAEVRFSHGATEAKAPYLGDAIADITESGDSLRENNLKIIGEIMETATVIVANRAAWADDWKRRKVEDLVMLLQGALSAQGKAGLKLNAPKAQLSEILQILPAMKEPTVSPLTASGWVAIETIVDTKQVRDLIPVLRRAGAQDFIEYPLNKVIP